MQLKHVEFKKSKHPKMPKKNDLNLSKQQYEIKKKTKFYI